MTATAANGVEGILIRLCNGEYAFRVYDADHNFVDYDLLHSDLCVTINDPDAFFYHGDGASKLDHSPETLGVKNE